MDKTRLPRAVTLRRVRLDAGGYSGNCYWGHDAPLYWVAFETQTSEFSDMIRAQNRDDAKRQALALYLKHKGA